MGKSRRLFRKSNRSISGDQAAKNFAQVNRGEKVYNKFLAFFKVRGKGEIN